MDLEVVELFAGVGSQTQSLKNLGVKHNTKTSEIDKYAIQSYNAVHGETENLGDISKIEKLPKVDLLVHSSPCQSFSVAGKQDGGEEGSGTRSSLMWETVRLLETSKPKFVLWENVKNSIGKKHRPNFDKYLETLEEMGYANYWKVLNAKHFGIPQNRERVFCLSIRNDIDVGFEFPEEKELELRLKDMLDDEVDEKYYISSERVNTLINRVKVDKCGTFPTELNTVTPALNSREHRMSGWKDICGTLCARDYKDPKVVAVRGRYNEDGKIEQQLEPRKDGITNTLTTVQKDNLVLEQEPSILKYERTEYGKQIRKQYESGEVNEKMANMRELVPRKDNISNTLTTVQKDNLLLEPIVCEQRSDEGLRFFKDNVCGTIRTINSGGDKRVIEQAKPICLNSKVDGVQPPQSKRVYDSSGVSITIDVGTNGRFNIVNDYRIRKLTPKECWRLMGFKDDQIEKAESVCSNTQLYKQAGNSIVVDVLEAIFQQMINYGYLEGTKTEEIEIEGF